MIRNIVFDMGGVLFTYAPDVFVKKYCPNARDAELVNRELFGAPEWVRLDLGTLSDEDYIALITSRVPAHLRPVTKFLFEHWHEMPKPLPQVELLVRELKEDGYGVYLLSNMSARFYSFYRNIPAMRYFDGMLISADVHCVKPNREIYRILFDRFHLNPTECFFLDDLQKNIDVGEALGMKGFRFRQEIGEDRAALRAAGVKASP